MLRLLLKDIYFECLLDLFARHKIEERSIRLVFAEFIDEFKHCMHASTSEPTSKTNKSYEKRLSLFT